MPLRKMPMIWAADLFGRSNNPCAVCGREVKQPARFFVHVIDGGSNVLHPDDEARYEPDGGELGEHDVGPECAKRFGEFVRKA